MQTCVQEDLKQCSYMQTCVQEELKQCSYIHEDLYSGGAEAVYIAIYMKTCVQEELKQYI